MLGRICLITIRMFFKFLFSEKASRKLIKMMPKLLPEKMLYPKEIQNYYIQDMPRLPRQTLITIYHTYMMQYSLKKSVADTKADVMFWYGEKEMKCIKNSAQKFKELVPSCEIYEAKGYSHGYLSLYLPEEWVQLAKAFFNR